MPWEREGGRGWERVGEGVRGNKLLLHTHRRKTAFRSHFAQVNHQILTPPNHKVQIRLIFCMPKVPPPVRNHYTINVLYKKKEKKSIE